MILNPNQKGGVRLNTKLHYGLMIGLAILFVFVVWLGIHEKKESESLERQVENHPTMTKKGKNESIKPDEVAEYKKQLEDKIHEYLNGEYKDDEIFNDNTAGNVFYRTFTTSGLSGLEKDAKKEDFKKRYKDTDFELNNVSAQKESDGGATVNANIKVKVGKGQELADQLISISFDSEGHLNGGELYDKSGKQ